MLTFMKVAGWLLPLVILGGEIGWIVSRTNPIDTATRFFEPAPADETFFSSPATITVPIQNFEYRPPGIYVQGGWEIDAKIEHHTRSSPLEITISQITEVQYSACVKDGACEPAASRWIATGNQRPVTGVNFDDANQYASWLSQKTGQDWRLPTDQEWVAIAGSRAVDDAIGVRSETEDRAARWLNAYLQTNEARETAGPPQTTGFYGANEFGVMDLSGNVWEWTSSCFSRTRLAEDGHELSVINTCNVRVVQGLHRTYITTFIRDAKAGGCSIGAPPSHLGFRLVRGRAPNLLQRLVGVFG